MFTAAWDAIQPQNLPNLATNLRNLITQATGLLKRVWNFATTVAAKVLELIKKALLGWLSSFATKTPGYYLLTVILGKDIFTQQVVPRTVTNIIHGFMSLLPNGEQQFKQMEETGVIARAAARIEAIMSQLGISWEMVRNLFLGIWNKITIESLIQPITIFVQIVNQFKQSIARLISFTIEVIKIVVELILQMMNFPPGIVGKIINNVMQAYDDLKKDPIGFFLNLLKTVKAGFGKFFDGIAKYLLTGVSGWLFSQLSKAGIEIPKDLTLGSILKLVFSVLGITVEKLWKKLADRIGQPLVNKIRGAIDKLVGIWNFIKDVTQRGMAAIWEYIQSQISNLWNMVLGFVRDWIMKKIVEKIVTKLLSMLDPTGIMAVVNSFMAFFNAIQSAIEYFRDLLEMFNSFVGTVGQIAKGALGTASEFLLNLLVRGLPVALGFLANQVGLGSVGDKLQEIIAGVHQVVEEALDWLVDKAVTLGKAALNALGLGKKDENPHTTLAEQAAKELQKVEGSPKEYKELRSQKEQQAKQIEEDYTKLLQPGIALKIKFNNETTDQTDQDIDFEVEIAPNNTVVNASIPTGNTVPKMDISPPFSSSKAQSPVQVKYLAKLPGNHETGSEPNSSTNREAFGLLRAFNISQKWVRFHVLNHNLGGKASESNLIPMPKVVNSKEYLPQFEEPMKTKFAEGKVLWMTATFSYHENNIFIQSYKAEGGEMKFDPNQNDWIEDPNNKIPDFSKDGLEYPISNPIPINYLYKYGSDFELQKVLQNTNVGIGFLRELFDYAHEIGVDRFEGAEDLESLADEIARKKYSERYANRVKTWINSTEFEW